MQLEPLLNRNIFELSGGEKQQIACGSVYAAEPSVFVMDEPSSNLDKKAIRRLHEILKKMKENGKTIVISEHRLHYLTDIADRFIYLDDGIITGEYSSEQLCALSDDKMRGLGLRCTDLSGLEKTDIRQCETVSSKAAIEAIDISCSRGQMKILDVEELRIPENSVVALIGDNGCGKSTLAETLCGVIPGSGGVALNGCFVSDRVRAQRSFMVMQDVNRQLFSDSVKDEICLNTQVSGEGVKEILSRLHLEGTEDRHPASLSGGQKQRVAIASAIAADKEFIFYDEPTSGLDRMGMESFGRLVDETRDKVKASVIITHDPELVIQCCTHVLHIENGRVLAFYPLDKDGVQRMLYYFLSPDNETRSVKRENISAVGKILQYASGFKKYTYIAVVLMLLGAVASVVPYISVYRIIDTLLSGGELSIEKTIPYVMTVFVCEIMYALLYTQGLKYSHISAYGTLENIRLKLQSKMENESVGDIKEIGTGAVKKLFIDDVESIEAMLAHIIPEGIANVSVAATVVIVLIAVDWQLALLTVIMLLFGITASKQMYVVGTDRMGSYFAAAKRLNNTIIEYVEGMEAVRIFNRQDEAGKRFSDTVYGYRDYALEWYKVCWPWMAAYASIFSTVALYSIPFGALLILIGQLTLSEYILILCLTFAIGPLLLHCIGFIGALPQVSFKIQSIEKAMDKPALKTGVNDFNGKDHSVTFNDVHFGYKGREVIKGISFEAKPQTLTAIIGESGSGKSTLAKLLAHFYDVQGGSISIGGQSITDMTADAHNALISYVSQDVFLFDRTIRENIRIGNPDASDDDVLLAAQKACCDDFVSELEQGYDTLVGTLGSKLSGGQRQRISFARAILKDAPIVVLDEAAAFVDAENEFEMNKAIAEMTKSKTVIMIAHRLKSVENADKIIVLDNGVAAAQGTHRELLKTSRIYQNLVSSGNDDYLIERKRVSI